MTYSNSIRQLARVGAILLVAMSVANAAEQTMQDKQDACMKRVEKKYNEKVQSCATDYTVPQDINKCIANAAKTYAASLKMCIDVYPVTTKPASNYGVGGPNAGGLDGWHPKGPKGKGLTSGQPGPVDGGSSGGGKGNHFTGTFNPGGTGAPLTLGQSGGIIQ